MSENPEKVDLLVFGAHPDDIEFGCGAVVAQETSRGAVVHFVVCSRGEAGTNGTPQDREREARQAAEILGASIEFLDLGGDAHLESTTSNVLKVASVIRRHRGTTLLAPTLREGQHPDHCVVGKLVRDGARLARYGGVAELKPLAAHAVERVLFFAVTPEGEPVGQDPLLVDVSEPAIMQRWTRAMEAHATQLRTRNYVELQLTRARLNGLRAGVEQAIALYSADPLVFDKLSDIGRGARRF
jgi:N-acetylglucosamine malate deacetylase 1